MGVQEDGARVFVGSVLRRTGTGERSERFEHEQGSITIGWSDDGHVIAFVTEHALAELIEPLAWRIMAFAPRTGPVHLYIDLTCIRSLDVAFCDDLRRLMRSGDRLVEHVALAVHRESHRMQIAALALELDGRLSIDDSVDGLESFLERVTPAP